MIHHNIPLEAVLDVLGVNHVGGPFWTCPMCDHRAFKVKGEVWYCHACGIGGGAVRVASLVWAVTVPEAIRRLHDELGVEITGTTTGRLIGHLDRIDTPPPPLDRSQAIRDVIDGHWRAIEQECRVARKAGVVVDPDTWFQAVMDLAAEGRWAGVVAARKACRLAVASIRRVWEGLGVGVEAAPVVVQSSAAIRMMAATRRHNAEVLATRIDIFMARNPRTNLCDLFDRIVRRTSCPQHRNRYVSSPLTGKTNCTNDM